MARKKVWIGSTGPFLFDDTDTYNDGVNHAGLRSETQIQGTNFVANNLSSNVRLTYSDGNKEFQEVNDLTQWIGGGSGINVVDDGDGSVTIQNVAAGENDFVTDLSFDTSTGVLTATVPNQANPSVDMDGRYSLQGHTHVAADLPSDVMYEGDNVSLLTNDAGYITSYPVDSVFGRTGAVTAQSGDYSFSQISGTATDGQLPQTMTGKTFSGLTTHQGGIDVNGTINHDGAYSFDANNHQFVFGHDGSRRLIDVSYNGTRKYSISARNNDELHLEAVSGNTIEFLQNGGALFSGKTTHQGGIDVMGGNKVDIHASGNNENLLRLSHPSAPDAAGGFLGFKADGSGANNNLITFGVEYSSTLYNVINIQRSTRNVGINQTSPSEALDVNGNMKASGAIYAQGNQEVWHPNNDGAGSGLDADLLDGLHASEIGGDEAQTVTIADNDFEKIGDLLNNQGSVIWGLSNAFALTAMNDTPNIQHIANQGSLLDVGTGTPTGTSGSDGLITIYINSSGEIYIENRLGSTQTFTYFIITA